VTAGGDLFGRFVRPVFVGTRDSVNRLLERLNIINTMGSIPLEELGIEGEGRSHYKPSEWTVLRRILPKREVGPDDVFVDFGSGLGRVVFQAARYPFRRVVGVELSEQLNAVARDNIEHNRHRLLCQDVELVTADATSFEVPDDMTVAFFANPFTGPTFHSVARGLLDSVDRRPRRLRVIYRNPVEHDYLMATGRFRPIRRLRGMRPSREWSDSNSTRMYDVIPRAAP
jgi:SAM-dependent methyltransferase